VKVQREAIQLLNAILLLALEETELILTALGELDEVLCIGVKVWPQNSTPTGDFAFIRKDVSSGICNSEVGKEGNLSICLLVAIHETVHALGIHHEQSRPDRDEFVTIYWNNNNNNIETGIEV